MHRHERDRRITVSDTPLPCRGRAPMCRPRSTRDPMRIETDAETFADVMRTLGWCAMAIAVLAAVMALVATSIV